MKTVFTDISQIAHLWANQTQENAKTSSRNFYFDGTSIYSYGYHFMIAEHVQNNEGVKAVLFTERTYSVTTSKHLSVVRQAANHLNLIYCYNPENSHEQNFTAWVSEIESICRKLTNAKKPEIYLNQIENVNARVNKYAAFFSLQIPAKLVAAMAITSKDVYKSYSASKAELEAKERKENELQLKKQHTKELINWRKYKIHRLYVRNGIDYLRLDTLGERIETTQGVKIPVETAKRFYPILMRSIKNGGCNGNCGVKILDYEVNEINKDFILVGCHKIQYKELIAMAKKLNLV